MAEGEADLSRLARRVRDDPRSTAFVALAESLRRAGRHVEALQVLREGFRAHPDHASGRVVLARVHLDLGRRSVAMAVLDEVTRSDPGNVSAGSTLARLLLDEGRVSEARPLVDRLLIASNGDSHMTELDAMVRAAEVASAVRGADPFDHPTLVDRLTRQGHIRRAFEMLTRILAVNPGNPVLAARIAEVERKLPQAAGDPRDPIVAPTGSDALSRYARRFWRSA